MQVSSRQNRIPLPGFASPSMRWALCVPQNALARGVWGDAFPLSVFNCKYVFFRVGWFPFPGKNTDRDIPSEKPRSPRPGSQ